MDNKWKFVALGAVAGAVACAAFALPAIVPKAIADEEPIRTLTVARQVVAEALEPKVEFFKPNWDVEDSVSTEVLDHRVVRKIEGGRTRLVTVVETATGLYSSDAMESEHILYPGLDAGDTAAAPTGTMALLVAGDWALLKPMDAKSFVEVVRTRKGTAIVDEHGTCHFLNGAMYC